MTLIENLPPFRLETPNIIPYLRQSSELGAHPTFLIALGSYFAPDFRGGTKNRKFAGIIPSKTEESTNPGISIRAVALACAL